ncbi:unnamed protein product [Parnassius apollo]|uniref:(apollo) hypothetical protein n=1 Tax=Parnassius apollo TaxID=110799 RepID=A0A8S3Y8L2_PARAO|nr:unnamed protein product [Parnassius apollo]
MNILTLCLLFHSCLGFFNIQHIASNTLTVLPKGFSPAVKDIVEGIPSNALTIVRGNSTNIRSSDIFELICLLNENNIQVINLDLTTTDSKATFFSFLKEGLDTSNERTSLILCSPLECENLLSEDSLNIVDYFNYRGIKYVKMKLTNNYRKKYQLLIW